MTRAERWGSGCRSDGTTARVGQASRSAASPPPRLSRPQSTPTAPCAPRLLHTPPAPTAGPRAPSGAQRRAGRGGGWGWIGGGPAVVAADGVEARVDHGRRHGAPAGHGGLKVLSRTLTVASTTAADMAPLRRRASEAARGPARHKSSLAVSIATPPPPHRRGSPPALDTASPHTPRERRHASGAGAHEGSGRSRRQATRRRGSGTRAAPCGRRRQR